MTNAQKLRAIELDRGHQIRGPSYHLAGAGPARYGYADYSATGWCDFLGATAEKALAEIQRRRDGALELSR